MIIQLSINYFKLKKLIAYIFMNNMNTYQQKNIKVHLNEVMTYTLLFLFFKT